MLDKLRENSRSIGTYIIFGAIIVVFVAYFGQGSLGFTSLGGAPAYAARVNGHEISFREFQTAYGSMLANYQQQTGGKFDEAMAEQLGLKDTVLDRLVERYLLVEVARENGLAVSDEEIKNEIRSVPAFQKNGQFDFPTYKAVLANNLALTPDKFEEQVRNDLLREKMIQQVRQAAKASDEEIQEEYRRDNDRANLTVVRLSASSFFEKANPTADEIKAYLATEEGKKAVEAQYAEQSFRFKQPKRVSAQHILVKVAEDAPESEVEAARARLAEAKKQIDEGADFGEVAKNVSEDPGSKENGGDLGFFGPGTMAKPFEDAAFALQKGQISEPVRTRFGLHLIKVNDIVEAKEQSLADVQDQLAAEQLRKTRARDLAKAKAEEILAQVKSGKKLADLFPAPEADPHGHAAPAPARDALAVAEATGPFAVESEYIPRIGANAELAAAVRTAQQGEALPAVYEIGDGFVVAEVTERTVPDMTAFEARKDEYRTRVVARKEAALLQDFTTRLREQARVEKNPEIFTSARG